MTSKKFFGILFCAAAVGLVPAIASAQSSTFIVPFERVGQPGTELQLQPDPLNPTQMISVPVDFGAFVNPCTLENVDVTGSSAITQNSTVDSKGNLKVDVSVMTKGTGAGWVGADYTAATFTGSSYGFNENQKFSFVVPPDQIDFQSEFSDKLSMRGQKSIDNWTVRALFRIKVSGGVITTNLIKLSGDVCKG